MPVDTLLEAAEGGTAAAQGALGDAYIEGSLGLDKDVVAGHGWLRKAAAQGQLLAWKRLGEAALANAGAPGADAAALLAEALDWLRPVAETGDAPAEYGVFVCSVKLADLLSLSGAEAAALYAEAVHWLRVAASHDVATAINALGNAAWDGDAWLGVARDRAEARRLFAAAHAAGLLEYQRANRPAGAPGSKMVE
jgi:TPR repeat protein